MTRFPAMPPPPTARTASLARVASLLAGFAALALLCWTFGFADLTAAFTHVRLRDVLGYLVLSAVVITGYGVRWSAVMRALGPPGLALPRLLAARVAGDAVGVLVPSGKLAGEPVRVALVLGDGVDAPRASAGVSIDRVLEMIGNAVCGAAYVTVFAAAHATGSSGRAASMLVATLVAFLVLLLIPLALLRRGRRPFSPLCASIARGRPRLAALTRALAATEDHLMRFFREHPLMFVAGLIGTLAIEGLIIAQYAVLLHAFGIDLDLPTLLLVLVGTGVARAVPTPAGLGALEAAPVAVLSLAAGQGDVGFVIGMVLRLHDTLWTTVGLAALSAQGWSMARLDGAAGKAGL